MKLCEPKPAASNTRGEVMCGSMWGDIHRPPPFLSLRLFTFKSSNGTAKPVEEVEGGDGIEWRRKKEPVGRGLLRISLLPSRAFFNASPRVLLA